MSNKDLEKVEYLINKKEITIKVHNSRNAFESINQWKNELVELYGGNMTLARKLKMFIRVYKVKKNKKILEYVYQYIIEDVIKKINQQLIINYKKEEEEALKNNTLFYKELNIYDIELYKNPL